MTNYKVEIDSFQGPLDLLLQLIENQELEITQVSLAKVADQFVYYINNHPEINPEEIADFLLIAAKLILIKSKALLPTLDLGDEDEVDLERQLKMYKQFIEASKQINKILLKGEFSYSKDKYPANLVEGFRPPKKVNAEKLHQLYQLLLKRIEPVVVLPKKIIERVVSIKEKIRQIRDRIMQQACISFRDMICDTGSKGERIVGFLALLELMKQRIVSAEQDVSGDITISKLEGAETRELITESEFI